MSRFLFICLGGAVGTGARYLVTGWAMSWLGASFPYGTLVVNILGSFLIGIIMPVGLSTDILSAEARIFLTTGVLGGFTTYSSFNYETIGYFQEGDFFRAIFNLLLMSASCLSAGFAGVFLSRKLIGF